MADPTPSPARQASGWEVFFVVGAFAAPYSLHALFLFLHPGEAPVRPAAVNWYLVNQAVTQVTLLGVLYALIRRGGERVGDFTEPSRWKGDLGWALGLLVLGYLASWPAYHLGSALQPRWEMSEDHEQNLELLRGHVNLAFVFMILINPLAEETFMRAYLQTRLRQKGWRPSSTVGLSVVLQSGYHLYQGIPSTASLAGVFLVFALFYQWTRRIWPVVIAHLLMDALAMLRYAR